MLNEQCSVMLVYYNTVSISISIYLHIPRNPQVRHKEKRDMEQVRKYTNTIYKHYKHTQKHTHTLQINDLSDNRYQSLHTHMYTYTD